MSGGLSYQDIGCGDGGCVFRMPKGMHTNGGCRCLPRPSDYDRLERLRLRSWICVMRRRIEELEGRANPKEPTP